MSFGQSLCTWSLNSLIDYKFGNWYHDLMVWISLALSGFTRIRPMRKETWSETNPDLWDKVTHKSKVWILTRRLHQLHDLSQSDCCLEWLAIWRLNFIRWMWKVHFWMVYYKKKSTSHSLKVSRILTFQIMFTNSRRHYMVWNRPLEHGMIVWQCSLLRLDFKEEALIKLCSLERMGKISSSFKYMSMI